MIDTHCHLDGVEYNDDRAETIARAREAGVTQMFIPAIDLPSSRRILDLFSQYPGVLYPMVGLHPEEVRADWQEQLAELRDLLTSFCPVNCGNAAGNETAHWLAIGEVGLDFYWSREFEQEQLLAFEEQVRWSVETRLPLMIHCRKAQNAMVAILKRYKDELPGGVFHCFTGNEIEAQELLQFPRFVLGIGGVLTFKKSHLPETLAGRAAAANGASGATETAGTTGATEATGTTGAAGTTVPIDRIVLETDSPYMAPVPHRGQRNEPAFVVNVLQRLAQAYGISEEELAKRTNENVKRVFGVTETGS